jgi:hypothetical protein
LINAKSAIIDGEIVVPAADGTTDFSVLQNELKGTSDKIVMVAFDFLYLNGQDVRKLPLMERKALLQKLIAKTPYNSARALNLTVGRCSGTPAKGVWKASCPRCGTAAIRPTEPTIGWPPLELAPGHVSDNGSTRMRDPPSRLASAARARLSIRHPQSRFLSTGRAFSF